MDLILGNKQKMDKQLICPKEKDFV